MTKTTGNSISEPIAVRPADIELLGSITPRKAIGINHIRL
jgi:hypothetical protein